jgi:hypothetical protein
MKIVSMELGRRLFSICRRMRESEWREDESNNKK